MEPVLNLRREEKIDRVPNGSGENRKSVNEKDAKINYLVKLGFVWEEDEERRGSYIKCVMKGWDI